MTAPASVYPRSVDDLYPGALALADQLGKVPSRNRLQKQFKIGAPKATELRERLLTRATDPAVGPDRVVTGTPVGFDYAEPIGPSATPEAIEADPGTRQSPASPTPSGRSVSPGASGSPAPTGTTRARKAGWGRRWFRPPSSVSESPQVRVDGHPGTQSTPEPVTADPAELRSLKRLRWAVRAALALGVAASIAGNVLHAQDELISQIISAWSPLALLLTIELISRVPVHRRVLAVARWAATALIAGIAAWVSYWHMAAVAARYGETGGSQYLLPLSVDGLVIVASICLVELGGRIAAATRDRAAC